VASGCTGRPLRQPGPGRLGADRYAPSATTGTQARANLISGLHGLPIVTPGGCTSRPSFRRTYGVRKRSNDKREVRGPPVGGRGSWAAPLHDRRPSPIKIY